MLLQKFAVQARKFVGYTNDLVKDGIDGIGVPGRRTGLAVRESDITQYSPLRRYVVRHRLVVHVKIERIIDIPSLAT